MSARADLRIIVQMIDTMIGAGSATAEELAELRMWVLGFGDEWANVDPRELEPERGR